MKEIDFVKTINNIIGITESYKATDRMLDIIYDRKLRENIMKQLLPLFDYDVSFDWFRSYFEREQAERITKKQDFTPQSLTELVGKLVESAPIHYDVCCGTGGITISRWYQDQQSKTVFDYKPSDFLYYCEELSDKTIPFLLFNLALRGMNAIVCQCDVISRQCYGIWFVYNENDDYLGFSTINLMPYSENVEREFRVKFVEKKYKPLIESKKPVFEENKNEI